MSGLGALIQGPGIRVGRTDQGVDFLGSGNVLALGAGRIIRTAESGWPGEGAYLEYELTDGPGKGKDVYIAEDFAPAASLRVGSRVRKGQILGKATGSGKAPGIEIGWATPTGSTLAKATTGYTEGQVTPAGQSFKQFAESTPGSKKPFELIPGESSIPVVGAIGEAAQEFGEEIGGGINKAVGGALQGAAEAGFKAGVKALGGEVGKEGLKILLYAVFVFGAMALMGYGVTTMISPRPPSLRKAAGTAAKAAAVAAA